MPQLPSLPIPGHDDLPDYDVCLPANLRPDTDRLIRYLHQLPYRPVRYCPWCGNTNVNLQNHSARQRLPRYYCGSCRKSCNSLSDSPFANMRRMELWSTFAVYLLAGWSSVQIAPRLGINHKVYFSWGQAVRKVMAEECLICISGGRHAITGKTCNRPSTSRRNSKRSSPGSRRR